MFYSDNIKKVKDIISQNKVVPEVTLIGVTKTLSTEQTEQAIQSGLQHIGENRLQIAEPKIMALANRYKVTWHFIGTIQKNKAKKIVQLFHVIHSVNSWDILASLNNYAKELNVKPDILLQVNVSGEKSKQGFSANEIRLTIRSVYDYSNVNFIGYMTMAPYTNDEDYLHSIFKQLKDLAEELKESGINYQHLSMGMSNDFIVALKDGATMVRLGTILFS
ncbi:MAG: YggS family pyridoxal phosphate-dependent enzyme [Candidatus Margulisbacteria bacterium]|nr:YggS family pyridoxal phosphate-dependent enzyme [Candidatus Margulisiibacteriota bacterium]